MTIAAPKFTALHMTVAGKRLRVSYTTGPWVEGVDPATIKIRPWVKSHFPAEVRQAFTIENNSNGGEDYFEADCIRLLPGHPFYDAVNAAAPQRRAVYEAERAARAAAFESAHGDLIKRARAVTDLEAKGGFIADVIMGGLSGRFVSDKALAAVTNAVADLERRATWNSEFLGTVGKRETFSAEVDRVAFFEGAFGLVWIITMRDEAGNAIVSKSTAFHAERGKKVTFKATIKEHSEFRGEKQTVVQRIKVAA